MHAKASWLRGDHNSTHLIEAGAQVQKMLLLTIGRRWHAFYEVRNSLERTFDQRRCSEVIILSLQVK